MELYKTVILLLFYVADVTLAQVRVNLPIGELEGRIENTQRNHTFYAFQSIPYGKPPVGDLRFQEPQPAGGWEGVYDAKIVNGNICYQVGGTTQEHESEDCLYLNIYTPVYPDPNAQLPIMVYIHGGAFLNGHSNFYGAGPHYLIEANIIVVTILYRLGPFGFMATGDEVVPGNMGLKDINLGLQWIQQYIQYFGGNPSEVTINGQSAGAAAITYQALSPKSAGLFRGVIAESGSALNTWTYKRDHRQQAYDLANLCGASFQPDVTSTEELVQFLRTLSPEALVTCSNNLPWTLDNQNWLHGFSFTPVIEPEYDGAFLTENMYEVIAAGNAHKVSYILGINSEELLSVGADSASATWLAQSFDGNLSYAVPDNMHLTDSNQLNAAGTALRQIYTSGTFQSDLSTVVRYYSDVGFTHSIIHHGFLQAAFSDVYFYIFSYHGQLGGNSFSMEGCEKVQHSEELAYIWAWGNATTLNNYPAADILTSNRIRGLFTNFVKTLNPTPTQDELFQNVIWPKVSPNNYQYLNIDENLSVQVTPKANTYPRWVNAYETFGIRPFDTY